MPRSMDFVKRAWHSERHQPIRGTLIQEIFRVVNEIHGSSTKKNKEYQEKLPVVVLRAEEILYSKANSEAEYMELATLLERTNDAIDIIIRRDEHTETGDYLHPCIEAALSLGCSLTKASSRSQRNNSSRCYLKEEVPNVSLNTSTIKLQQVSENVPSSVYYGHTSESAAIIGGGAQRSQSFITSTDDSEKNTSTDKCDLSLRLGPFK